MYSLDNLSASYNRLLGQLCSYDSRNPNRVIMYDENGDEEELESPVHCYCDNCFYGRTPIANFAISLIDQ